MFRPIGYGSGYGYGDGDGDGSGYGYGYGSCSPLGAPSITSWSSGITWRRRPFTPSPALSMLNLSMVSPDTSS
jgi:hypothetical protein